MPLPRFQKLEPARQRAILAAAASEFSERGFESASYNQIIERAGVSKGAMYYYFADKEDIFRTVLETAISQWAAVVMVPVPAEDAATFWEQCEVSYRRSLTLMLEDPHTVALCMAVVQARAANEGHPVLLSFNAQVIAWMKGLVEHGQRVGAVRTDVPSDLLVQAGLALTDAGDRWLAARWEEMSPDRVEATASMMVGMFRRLGEP